MLLPRGQCGGGGGSRADVINIFHQCSIASFSMRSLHLSLGALYNGEVSDELVMHQGTRKNHLGGGGPLEPLFQPPPPSGGGLQGLALFFPCVSCIFHDMDRGGGGRGNLNIRRCASEKKNQEKHFGDST